MPSLFIVNWPTRMVASPIASGFTLANSAANLAWSSKISLASVPNSADISAGETPLEFCQNILENTTFA